MPDDKPHHNSQISLVLRKRKFDHITDDLHDLLHWLPIHQRIQYKFVLVYKCLRGDAPSYLADMISAVGKGSQRLRSAAHGNIAVPPTRTVRKGPRSFAVSGPTLWNSARGELLVSWARSALKQCRAFSAVGPSTWNELPLTLRLLP